MVHTAHLGEARSILDVAVGRLRAFAPVERVILFGSRARGDHAEDSDWDLCVLLRDDIPAGVYTLGSMWRAVRGLGLTIQVVPMRRSVFDTLHRDVNTLAHDVARDGLIIFDDDTAQRPNDTRTRRPEESERISQAMAFRP